MPRWDEQFSWRMSLIADYTSPNKCQNCHDMVGCDKHLTFQDVKAVESRIVYDVHLDKYEFFRVFIKDYEVSDIEYHYHGMAIELSSPWVEDIEDWLRYNVAIKEME